MVAHRQRGRIDKGDARAAAFPCVQIAAQWPHRAGHQLDETTGADQGREVRAQGCGYVLGVVMFAVAVVAAVERDDDRHDFTERQRRLAGALALAALEQAPHVERLEPLAKVVDIAEHGHELAHRDLHMVQAAFRDTATIRRSLWAGTTLPLIPNSGYFMPRIRDLKDQQLYRVDRFVDYGVFTPLLTKTADLTIIEEQWDEMIRVALSLKQRTAPAHVIVQRLTNSFPADRLAKAFTNLGRIIKTQYILRYLTDRELRRTVQLQLNKGEYRHKLPRRIFFADQGAFTTGDYEEIMNKASCLSLVSNAILYWNTIKSTEIVDTLRAQGEDIDKETLAHISLLPFRHVVPNGMYFIEEV